MVSRKCVRAQFNDDSTKNSDDSGASLKKRTVTRKTMEAWMSQYDKEFNMMRRLDFSIQGDGKHVAEVKCKACHEFNDQFEGTNNARSSAMIDHAKSASNGSLLH